MSKQIVGLSPENIGKVVTIQYFHLDVVGGDEISPESLEKHVGVLDGYSYLLEKDAYIIQIRGWQQALVVANNLHHAEVIPFVLETRKMRYTGGAAN